MNLSILVIVPTLDSSHLLPRLLLSLQHQSFRGWRILFIDGPSSSCHRRWLERCCAEEPRCNWLEQDPLEPGIFGAMNQGFALARPADWVLFWGSDDWAATPNVLAEAATVLERAASDTTAPDLVVCRGRYADVAGGVLTRPTVFQPANLLSTDAFRQALLFGSTPPHQATFFGPRVRQLLPRFASGFCLSADLDYFLQLSRYPGLVVQCLDLELVHIADSGVSGQQTQRRLQEVQNAYRRAFGWLWWFAFLMRYLRRLKSLLVRNR